MPCPNLLRAILSEARTAVASTKVRSCPGDARWVSYSVVSLRTVVLLTMVQPTRAGVSTNTSAGEQAALQGHVEVSSFRDPSCNATCITRAFTVPDHIASHHC